MESRSIPRKAIGLFAVLLATISIAGGVQAADPTDPAMARIEALREQVDRLNQRLDRQEREFSVLMERERDLNQRALRIEVRSELAQALSKVEEARTAVTGKYVELAGILAVIIGIAGAVFWGVINWAKQRIQSRIEEEIDRRRDLIRSMFDLFEAEQAMVRGYRLEVVSKDASHGDELAAVLRRLGFRNVGHCRYGELDGVKADMFVFGEDLEDEEIDQFLAKLGTEQAVVCYTQGQRRLKNRNKANFANSHLTLHSRIIETLKASKALGNIG